MQKGLALDLDQGPIVAQEAFNVDPHAELREVVRTGRELESKVLVDGVAAWLDGLDVGWGKATPTKAD